MLKLAELNALTREEFVARRRPGLRAFALGRGAQLRRNGRLRTREQLHEAMCAMVASATADEKLALIRAHPDLVGDARPDRANRKASRRAPGSDDLTRGRGRAVSTTTTEQYRERFGFPFVICARLNKKEAILRAFPERLRTFARRKKSKQRSRKSTRSLTCVCAISCNEQPLDPRPRHDARPSGRRDEDRALVARSIGVAEDRDHKQRRPHGRALAQRRRDDGRQLTSSSSTSANISATAAFSIKCRCASRSPTRPRNIMCRCW